MVLKFVNMGQILSIGPIALFRVESESPDIKELNLGVPSVSKERVLPFSQLQIADAILMELCDHV
jgi:hypothetical protein